MECLDEVVRPVEYVDFHSRNRWYELKEVGQLPTSTLVV